MNLIYVFLVIVAYKVVRNTVRYSQCNRLRNRYVEWLATESPNVFQDKATVIKVLKSAGVTDSYIGIAEHIGYMQIRSGNVSIFDNYPNRREDFVHLMIGMFDQAIGTYRSRIVEAFNPLYWIELVINLPRELGAYLGLSPENFVTKIVQVLWWLLATATTTIYLLYKPEVDLAMKAWLDEFVKR